MKFTGIILASGKSERFDSSIPKQFMSLNGKAVIQYSIDVIEPLVDELIIVSDKQYKDYNCVAGGDTRSQSVENGLNASTGDFVIIHDGARPFLRPEIIEKHKELLLQNYKYVDTRSEIIDGFVENGICDRKFGKYLGLTPESFKRDVLEDAFNETEKRDWQDETSMVQNVLGIYSDAWVEGQSFNSKITFQEDLGFAEGLMRFWNRPIETKPDLNKRVLVFGGSGDIGKACIEQLKSYYAPTRKEVDLSQEWFLDLKDYDSIIYSAGEYNDENKIMKVNFDSCVRLIKLAEEQEWKGNIVFLSSTSSTYGRKGIPIYSASKSALNAYIEAKHEELAEKGIYINAIAPAKVWGKLQQAINPGVKRESTIEPDYVADFILRYTDTKVSGHVIYLRKGFDV